jgi:hypothetical protein
MMILAAQRLKQYRVHTFHTLPQLILHSAEDAVEFVNERGFVLFWPNQGVTLPSLWVAVAGDRPVADEHDDPGHVTWGWKDSLLGQHRWYYARILNHRNTILSLEMVPYFYALSENYGSPEEDYLIQYEEGRLTQEAKAVYETLLKEGALDTISLRKAAHLSSRESDSRFNRALDDLQMDFKILPVGVAEAGAWRYAFIYDVVTRHMPELQEQARPISEGAARRIILQRYFLSVGAARMRDLTRLFRWRSEDLRRALQHWVAEKWLAEGVQTEGQPGEWYTLAELCEEAAG